MKEYKFNISEEQSKRALAEKWKAGEFHAEHGPDGGDPTPCLVSFCPTLKMSHVDDWREMCASTDRDKHRNWLHRLVRLLPFYSYIQRRKEHGIAVSLLADSQEFQASVSELRSHLLKS